jgi:hypothetical protein
MPPGARYDPTLWSKSRDDENHEPTVGRWFRVTTADLVDPSGYPVNEWQALETLAWLCRGAARLEFEAYHEQTVWDLLRGASSHSGTGPLRLTGDDWPTRVRRCLAFAILRQGDTPTISAWREALGITYGATLRIAGPTIRPYTQKARDKHQPGWGQMKGRLTSLLTLRGSLAWSLNNYHPDAVVIQQISLDLGERASVNLSYGTNNERCASSWSYTLAAQEKGEPLLFVIDRAGAALGQLLDPAAEAPLTDRYRADGGVPALPAPWTAETSGWRQEQEAAAGKLAATVQRVLDAHDLDPRGVASLMNCPQWMEPIRMALNGTVSHNVTAHRIIQATATLGLTNEERCELLEVFGCTKGDQP